MSKRLAIGCLVLSMWAVGLLCGLSLGFLCGLSSAKKLYPRGICVERIVDNPARERELVGMDKQTLMLVLGMPEGGAASLSHNKWKYYDCREIGWYDSQTLSYIPPYIIVSFGDDGCVKSVEVMT
ncbi:MAG TPA: hypothetical protein PL033_20540 [Candidatus Brocadiia bacterium]|nr:hypothetical protein [Candidatus Brocadiia bacterium]